MRSGVHYRGIRGSRLRECEHRLSGRVAEAPDRLNACPTEFVTVIQWGTGDFACRIPFMDPPGLLDKVNKRF